VIVEDLAQLGYHLCQCMGALVSQWSIVILDLSRELVWLEFAVSDVSSS